MHDAMFSDGGLQLWQLQACAKLLLTQDMSRKKEDECYRQGELLDMVLGNICGALF